MKGEGGISWNGDETLRLKMIHRVKKHTQRQAYILMHTIVIPTPSSLFICIALTLSFLFPGHLGWRDDRCCFRGGGGRSLELERPFLSLFLMSVFSKLEPVSDGNYNIQIRDEELPSHRVEEDVKRKKKTRIREIARKESSEGSVLDVSLTLEDSSFLLRVFPLHRFIPFIIVIIPI